MRGEGGEGGSVSSTEGAEKGGTESWIFGALMLQRCLRKSTVEGCNGRFVYMSSSSSRSGIYSILTCYRVHQATCPVQ